jgi:hypothetical protein
MVHQFDGEAWKAVNNFDANSPVMQEMFASGWRQMTLIHSVQTPRHTLVGMSLFFHTTYHLHFV